MRGAQRRPSRSGRRWRWKVGSSVADTRRAFRQAPHNTCDKVLTALRWLGVQPDATLGVPVTMRQAFDADRRVIGERIHAQTVTS
ncbi:hypothetical protein Rmf_04270 [Roseomonas fluvialis]|uniref:Uncharacterized protein n=1 Tax=Roseomonas fluvialis TaxID=1750527 RepID=A0ABN6NVN4_9PROT|nr:hypothetical protein Rmf_04270 [Roseomonas fluvialis]